MNDAVEGIDRAEPVAFSSRTIDVDGAEIRIAEAGQGDALLYVAPAQDRLAGLLAAQFRVIAVQQAGHIAAIVKALGLDPYSICVEGANARAALSLAIGKSAAPQRLILIAPEVLGPEQDLNDPTIAERLQDSACDILLLFGTDTGGAGSETASAHREKIPRSHLMYIFDAEDPARSRPEAAASVIADFINRGDGFLVSEADGRLFP